MLQPPRGAWTGLSIVKPHSYHHPVAHEAHNLPLTVYLVITGPFTTAAACRLSALVMSFRPGGDNRGLLNGPAGEECLALAVSR